MRKIITLVLGSIIFYVSAFAHQDCIINIKRDGTLEGIPVEFGKANLLVKFDSNKNADHPVLSVTITIGKNKTALPSCITNLLMSASLTQVKASASWYHDPNLLPYYLSIQFYDPEFEKMPEISPLYSLLFNLRTGKLMSLERITKIRGDGSIINWKTKEINIQTLCNSENIKSFFDSSGLRP